MNLNACESVNIRPKHKNGSGPEVIEMNGVRDLFRLNEKYPERYPFFLKSSAVSNDKTASGESSRYDILFAFPGDRLLLDQNKNISSPFRSGSGGNTFLDSLDAWWKKESRNDPASHLPFTGGWFLFLSYELAGEIEPVLRLPSGGKLPAAAAIRIPSAIINDHALNKCCIVSENKNTSILEIIKKDLETVADKEDSPGNYQNRQAAIRDGKSFPGKSSGIMEIAEENDSRYISAAEKALEYIYSGDVFQVNLSRKWTSRIPGQVSSQTIFRNLMKNNPAPFSGFASFPEGDIISSSPERLLQVKNRTIETRPIAGTRPRNHNENDASEEAYLRTNPKEHAEHRMLIDLERNDLGKVCEFGSIRIDENMIVEKYAHVHHIVSKITGRLLKNATPGKIIKALFPGGTITGCPKVRCMEIIAELEKEPRGAYTGSMGYLNLNGDMDLNILIRSFVRTEDRITFRAGAGIVADSVPERELEETRAKAKGLILAMEPYLLTGSANSEPPAVPDSRIPE